ncbi:MAG: oligosaccharide flippase family protein [Pyrinomonadaceae bacterium]
MAERTEKNASLKAQGAWLVFAKVCGFAISFLLPLLIVRYLTQNEVGVYRQSFDFITNAIAILPLGVSMSAYYFLNREEENRKKTIFNILLFNFVVGGLACLGLFIYPQFLGRIYQSAEMTALAPKIGLVVWIWVFSTFLETVAIANQEARLATVFIILAQLTKTILMASAVIVFSTVEAFLYAAMIQGILQTGILLYYLNSRFPRFWADFSWHFLGEQLHYAVPFGLAGLLWVLQTDIHRYFIGYRFTSAEYAIYVYGCFQLPLLSVLVESTGAVLISRMSELQARGDKREIIELSARAMEKLSFFYFPAYVFMLITASVFITTLFTDKYAASIPIFIINLTLLPFDIWVIDPVMRAYKEFGRFLVAFRVFVLIGLVAALWFGIRYLDLTGMISIVVAISLAERFFTTGILMRKLEVRWSDWKLLKNVGKTGLAALFAGGVMFLVYRQARQMMPDLGGALAGLIFSTPKKTVVEFLSGSLTLGVSFVVFAPVYLFIMNYLGLIDEEGKGLIRRIPEKLGIISKDEPVPDPQSRIPN